MLHFQRPVRRRLRRTLLGNTRVHGDQLSSFLVSCSLHPGHFGYLRLVQGSSFAQVFPSNSPLQFQAHHPADISGVDTEQTYETHSISSVVGSVRADLDSTSNLNSELGVNSKSQVFTTTADTSLPRSLPVVVTTSDGRILFNAKISLPSNQIIATSSSSVEFSVDVVAFRNVSSCKTRPRFSPPPKKKSSLFQQPSATTVPIPRIPSSSSTATNLIS